MLVTQRFEDLPLHDAILEGISIQWDRSRCILTVAAFVTRGEPAQPCVLTFDRISRVVVPHEEPWGRSGHIYGQRSGADGMYVIEMQSGDEIQITAGSFDFARV
jgi:hypothetical protein